MRQCYFCGTKKGLKAIWIEDDDKSHSACFGCFTDEGNSMEEWNEISELEWDSKDYWWKSKPLHNRQV